jgi:type II secretory pathway pseudopilin PulG
MIELVMVIIIIGILAGVATMKMMSSIETAKFEATRSELDQLAKAIAGDAAVESDGARGDFGYVGDVGALPVNLDALAVNPGYATWHGPYIGGNSGDDYKRDAWGAVYVYAGTLLRSVGSGLSIERAVAPSSSALLSNSVSGYLLDADINMPGPVYNDSLIISLFYPDGSGNLAMATVNPDPNGSFSFAGIPVGNHLLRVVYIPDSDTVEYELSVNPASGTYIDIIFPADLW